MADALDSYPTLFISGLMPSITEMDLVKVLNDMGMETKVMLERDATTSVPLGRIRLIFRYQADAERFYATVNGSMFLGAKVHLTFKDPNMNFTNTSGAKSILVKHIPLGVTSLEFHEAVRAFGRIISCKVMIDRSGTESYALLQYENQDDADKCILEFNGTCFRGNTIALTWQFPKNSPYQYPSKRTSMSKEQAGQWSQQWGQPTPPGSPSVLSDSGAPWPANPRPTSISWDASKVTAWQPSGPMSPVSPGPRHAWESTPASTDAAIDPKNLYVKNLEEHVDNLELFSMFRRFGRIISARVMRDDVTGRSKGFGFVSFETSEMASKALNEMNGVRLGARQLVVNIAEPKGYRQKRLSFYHAAKQQTAV
ncbi:Protein phosphatase PP2A regulatory subunit B [Gaertneriomyces sp. JEL0708]|nr:Protein phosphatase PP2A regulatory subunit B [Gaertneriomyces sp. JEL0708]